MHVKDYIGRIFDEDRLKAYNPNYYSDDDMYESMISYRVILQTSYDDAPPQSSYYLEIVVDSDKRIKEITRNLDELAFTNYPRTRFPRLLEEEAEETLNECTI